MGEQPPSTALAQVKRLPKDSFLCIEFPGYVENQNKAMETLGGVSAVLEAHATKSAQIPLNFRPNDPWSHPIFLDRYLTSNFVLEVTKKTDPETGETSVSGDIIGTIPQVYTFTGLADYQYLPMQLNDPPLDPLSDTTPLRGDLPTPLHFPPPIFSKTDHAHPYRFEPNSWFKMVEVPDENGGRVRKFVPKKTRAPGSDDALPNIQFESETIPMEPPAEPLGPIDPEVVALLTEMFNAHPVWSRPALEIRLSKYPYNTVMIPCLYQVSYTFSSGPWRLCWVKLGFDPRKDPSSRRYQIIDFRANKQQIRGDSAVMYFRKPLTDKPSRLNARSLEAAMQSREALNKLLAAQRADEYRFTKPPSQQQTNYWLHELHLEGLAAILDRSPAARCSRENGWFTAQAFKDIRSLMKKRLPTLIEEWDSGNFAAKIKAAEMEVNMFEDPSNAAAAADADLAATSSSSHMDVNTSFAGPSHEESSGQVSGFLAGIARNAASATRSAEIEDMATHLADADSEEEFALLEDD
jgi:general transcription factor 3C polypeptide 5 (transcription factor C subunit 1)